MKGGNHLPLSSTPSPAQALAAAKHGPRVALDVRIGGGPATVRQFLAAGLGRSHAHRARADPPRPRPSPSGDGLEGLEERFAIEVGELPRRRHPRPRSRVVSRA